MNYIYESYYKIHINRKKEDKTNLEMWK